MRKRPLLFVGQAPSRHTVGKPALSNGSGERLAEIFGYRRVNEFADAVNVFEHWPGKSRRNSGCIFPIREARERAFQIRELFIVYRVVIILGRSTSRGLGFDGDPLTWNNYRYGGTWRSGDIVMADLGKTFDLLVGHLPHPSGVNRWYHDRKNRLRAASFAYEVLTYAGL